MPNSESSDCNGNVGAIQRREFLLRWARRLGCAALIVSLGLGGLRGYAAWRKQHLGGQLQQFVAHGEFQSAVLVARRLLELDAGAGYTDALLYFHALQGTEAAAPALEELKAKAAASPATTAELITWLNRNGMAVVAAAWSSRLPREFAETQPVPLAIAESYSFLQDWPALRDFVEGRNWRDHEAFRLAVESHALHRLSADRRSMETQTTWRAALKTAQSRPDQLVAIAQLAEGWGYQDKGEEAWWMVAGNHENPKVGLAAKLHSEHPANRAFALHTEGRLDESLKVMEGLKEEELRQPAIAAYYVVLLVENGQLDRARSYLDDAQRATLLPGEQQLLSAAARKLGARS